MNVCQLIMLFYVGLLCLATGLTMPTKSRSHRTSGHWHSSHEKRKFRSEDRRLKFLQKMLRKLQTEDIEWLIRQKKFASYADYDSPMPSDSPFSNSESSSEVAYRDLQRKASQHPKYSEIKCPLAEDGVPLLACPTPDRHGTYHCIDDNALCDDTNNCPGAEDEDMTMCMFRTATMRYVWILMDRIREISDLIV